MYSGNVSEFYSDSNKYKYKFILNFEIAKQQDNED